MKKYAIKEVFATLQGEGAQSGRPAVFLRFAGCNLGYEVCPWCDTDWVRPEYLLPLSECVGLVVNQARTAFGRTDGLLLVATGGEPSLQLDRPISAALRQEGFTVSMESNGSRSIDRSIVDWLTISPKEAVFAQKEGDELKIVFSGASAPGPAPDLAAVSTLAEGTHFDHYWLQPLDLPGVGPNLRETAEAVLKLGPPWKLSLQIHKIVGLP